MRYLDFCVFVKSSDFKICEVIIGIATYWKLNLCLFLLNSKYYQNEIWPNTSVFVVWETFLTCFWLNAGNCKLVPGLFMVLLKWQYNEIWPFLTVDIYYLEVYYIDLLYWFTILKRSWNLSPVLQIVQKFPKSYIYQFAKFDDLMGFGLEDIVKSALCLMY